MIKNKKIIVITIITLVIVVIATAIAYQHNSKAFGTGGSMTIKETVAYQKSCGDMQKKLGTDSLYPVYYTAIKSEQDAGNFSARSTNDEIESGLIRYLAIEWYAENHGITVTETDVQRRIETLIDGMKRTEEYQEYQDAAREMGTTYEEIIRNDYQTEYFAEVSNRIYMQEYDKIMTNTELTQDEMEQQDVRFQKYWDNFINNIIQEYQKTQDFEIKHSQLSKCRTLANKQVSESSQLKKAGL